MAVTSVLLESVGDALGLLDLSGSDGDALDGRVGGDVTRVLGKK